MDFFRISKLGAAFYQSQVDPSARVVLQPAFYWDFGPGSPATGPGHSATVWSNCDRLEFHIGGRRVATALPQRDRFPHLARPPFVADLSVRHGQHPDLRIDGFVGDRLAVRRSFSADPTLDQLSCVADDRTLTADGQDATRVVLRAVDRYGAARPYVAGALDFAITGPGVLVGDNPFDFEAAGGAGAVWIRTIKGLTGQVILSATIPPSARRKQRSRSSDTRRGRVDRRRGRLACSGGRTDPRRRRLAFGESTAGAGESTSQASEPTARADESSPRADEPTPRAAELITEPGEPTPGADELTPGAREPTSCAGEPTSCVGESTPGPGESALGSAGTPGQRSS